MRVKRSALALCLTALMFVGCLSHQRPALLRIATGDSGAGLAPHRDILGALEHELPQYHLQLEPVSGGDYYTRLLTELASGSPPDILQVGDDAVGWFVARGCLLDLTPSLHGPYPLDPSQFFPALLEPGQSQGGLYVLPKDYTTLAVYCNLKLFRQAGLAPPRADWDMEQFLEVAQQLTRPQQFGLVIPGVRGAFLEWLVLLHGGQLFDPQRQSYEGALNSATTLRAVNLLHEMYYERAITPLPTELGSFNGGNLEFEQGRAAMKIGGHWNLSDLRRNPNIELAVLPLPGLRAGGQLRRANILHWAGMGISRKSRHLQASWRVLRRYCGPQGSKRFSAGWALPAVRSVADQSGLLDDPLERVWLDELRFVRPRAYQTDALWMQVGQPAVARVHEAVAVDPTLKPEALLDQVAHQADSLRRRRTEELGP